jgi:hypothetical protein
MKTIVSLVSSLAALTMTSAMAQVTYTGPGTALGSSPADGAAISSVLVNNTASTISFTINSTAAQASYIFYGIELQIVGQAGNGYTGFANPFGPAIGISTGVNSLIDTYGTGASTYTYSAGWTQTSSGAYAAGGTGNTFSTITVPLSTLGLNVGDSFYFDVVSTYTSQQNGGPQSAYGALASTGYPAESDGAYTPYNGTSHYDSATDATSTFGQGGTLYTVQPVPEPASGALMGFGALVAAGSAMLRRKI